MARSRASLTLSPETGSQSVFGQRISWQIAFMQNKSARKAVGEKTPIKRALAAASATNGVFPGSRLSSRFGSKRAPFGQILLLALSFALIAALSGCVTMAIRDTKGPMASTSDEESFAEFMDVPYPAVMTLERDSTFSYSRREVKAGVVTVLGKMTVDELGAFYDSHLPSHGWSPLVEAQSKKLVSTWTKGGKVLTIIATPVIMAIGGNLRVELWVAPPHTKGDLGSRIVYRSSDEGKAPIVQTKPIRGNKGGINEENI